MNQERINTRIGIGMNIVTIYDSLAAIDALLELQKKHDITPVLIYGFNDGAEEIKYLARSSQSKMRKSAMMLEVRSRKLKNFEWHPYPVGNEVFEELDIALVPAKHNSALFGYYPEFVNAKVPCICSNVEPFNKLSPCLTENTKEAWVEAIEAMIMFNDVREAAVNQQKYEQVLSV